MLRPVFFRAKRRSRCRSGYQRYFKSPTSSTSQSNIIGPPSFSFFSYTPFPRPPPSPFPPHFLCYTPFFFLLVPPTGSTQKFLFSLFFVLWGCISSTRVFSPSLISSPPGAFLENESIPLFFVGRHYRVVTVTSRLCFRYLVTRPPSPPPPPVPNS